MKAVNRRYKRKIKIVNEDKAQRKGIIIFENQDTMKGKRSGDIIKVERSLEITKKKEREGGVEEATKMCDCHNLGGVPERVLELRM